jgi:hypothetical protein
MLIFVFCVFVVMFGTAGTFISIEAVRRQKAMAAARLPASRSALTNRNERMR